MDTKQKLGPSMDEWSRSLTRVNLKLSNELDVPRNHALTKVVELGLPHCARFNCNLQFFFKFPERYLHSLQSELVYVNLRSKNKQLSVYRQPGISKSMVTNIVKSIVKESPAENYDLTVSEYYENQFGGNIVVNRDGTIYGEFKNGAQWPISDGSETPEFTFNMSHSGTIKYSFEDVNLRRALFNTLRKIPHNGSNYLPGYYEFQLVKKGGIDDVLSPIFIDYRDSSSYLSS
jgi:hypothetical protein